MQNPSKWKLQSMAYDLSEEFPLYFFSHQLSKDGPNYLHFHREIELGYCRSGRGIFYIDRHVHRFSAGAFAIVFPNQVHIAHNVTEETSEWFFAEMDADRMFHDVPACGALWKRLINLADTVPNFFDPSKHPKIYYLMQAIFQELSEKESPAQDYLRALLWALLTQLDELCGTHRPGIEPPKDAYHLIWPALEYIVTHYEESIEFSHLTRLCFCSEASLRRAFQAVMGCTPMQYLTETRIRVADTLLRTTKMSVCDISLSVGYQNVSSFNRQFQQLRHMSPTEFRNR